MAGRRYALAALAPQAIQSRKHGRLLSWTGGA
jgi:hypothetical protein